MWQKIGYGILGVVAGIIIGFFFLQKTPDVSYKHDTTYLTDHSSGTTSITTDTHAVITGGTSATIKPDGTAIIAGTNLSIDSSAHTAATILTVHDILYKEKLVEKEIFYTASIYVLWDPMDLHPWPAVIGASILIVNPVYLSAQYLIEIKKVYVGPELKF